MAINCRWRSVVARSIVVGDQLSLDQLSLAISCRSINCRWRSIVAVDQLSLAINCRRPLILSTPFPGSHSCTNSSYTQSPEQSQPPRRLRRKWKKSIKIFKPERIKWAINSFKPYKSAGLDKIFPALL